MELQSRGPATGSAMIERQDRAKLYSLAFKEILLGYRSFSASREQVRGQFRRRMIGPKPDETDQEDPSQAAPIETRQQGSEIPADPAPVGPLLPLPSGEATLSRWYALHSVFTPPNEEIEKRVGVEPGAPILAVFSSAGGVGKTCLVATLGRCLSAFQERVLLAEMAVCGLLPFYFGSRDMRPGVRIFSPPGAQGDAPVQILNLQGERHPVNGNDPILGELKQAGRRSSRILLDMATGSREGMKRLLQARPTILVPLLPDMSSVASLELLEELLASPLYVLNQFDVSSPLHLAVRTMLQQRLGNRLLPFVLHHSSAVSEALAEGMTVLDYAPDSGAAQDYRRLAAWLRGYAAPVVVGYQRARWSER
jgi:cellulose biosynthesis protein BcsQ